FLFFLAFFFFQAEDGIRDRNVTGVQTCALPILRNYASLENEHKATLVSAILLALKYQPELLGDLTGDQRNGYRDGEKVYTAAKEIGRASCRERGKVEGGGVA